MGQISTPNEVSVSYPRISYRFLLTVQKDLLSKEEVKTGRQKRPQGAGKAERECQGEDKGKKGGN
jgi:hypothetical protein